MVSAGDERAIDAEFMHDLEVVQGVAHEEDFGWWDGETADEGVAEGDFAVGGDVIEAGDMVEVRGEAEVRDNFVKGFVAIRRENGLAQPGPGGGGEHPDRAPVERTFEPAGVVTGNKLHAEPVKAVDHGIELRAAAVVDVFR